MQTGVKFRDEMKPRFGLIRAREFVMKDMYTFDGSETAAKYTYERVSDSYAAVMKRLKLDYLKGNSLFANIPPDDHLVVFFITV